MTTTLIDQLQDAMAGRKSWTGLAAESPLRVAASMLSHASRCDLTGTRVVGTIGGDDADSLEALVTAIAEEFGLASDLEQRGGSYTVRFYRPDGSRAA